MIEAGFYPLVGGLGITSCLIAWSDLRTGWLTAWYFGPALVGMGVFYQTSLNLTSFLFVGATALFMVVGTWLTLKLAHRKNEDSALVGKGDYLAVAVFSFWPAMVIYAMMLALMFGIAGFRFNWWNRGLRGIPLAGLMGIFCLIYILYLVVI